MVLRPDEAAAQSEIERDKDTRSKIGQGLKFATTAGLGASAAAFSKLAPFFSEYIPLDLAMKGINKISPKLGAFLKKGEKMGLDVKEGIDFIKDKFSAKEPAKENKNLIEKYSPELFQFMKARIAEGKSPIDAGALAAIKQSPYLKAIRKMEEDNKTSWSSIIESVFGTAQKPQNNQQAALREEVMNPSGSQPTKMTAEGMAAQKNQNIGPGQQALMGILQSINQKLGM